MTPFEQRPFSALRAKLQAYDRTLLARSRSQSDVLVGAMRFDGYNLEATGLSRTARMAGEVSVAEAMPGDWIVRAGKGDVAAYDAVRFEAEYEVLG